MTKLYRILVICTGNVCRSPMGEGFLNLLAGEAGLDHVVVESAGTHAPEGSPPTSLAIQAAAELGADIRGHRAAYLDRSMVKEADLILVMEPAHLEFILARWPEDALDKVRLMRTFHPGQPSTEEVEDPIGAALPLYRQVARLMKECAEGVMRGLSAP